MHAEYGTHCVEICRNMDTRGVDMYSRVDTRDVRDAGNDVRGDGCIDLRIECL